MNDRSQRRELRFDLISRISKLEIANCHVCTKRARSNPTTCHDCPIFQQLGMLGEELNRLCVRAIEQVKIIEIPEPLKPVRIRKKSKTVNVIKPYPYPNRKRKEKATSKHSLSMSSPRI